MFDVEFIEMPWLMRGVMNNELVIRRFKGFVTGLLHQHFGPVENIDAKAEEIVFAITSEFSVSAPKKEGDGKVTK